MGQCNTVLPKLVLPTSMEDFQNEMKKLEFDQRNLYFFRVRHMRSSLPREYFREKINDVQRNMVIWDLKTTLINKNLFQNENQAIAFEYFIQQLTQIRDKIKNNKLKNNRPIKKKNQQSVKEFNYKMANLYLNLKKQLDKMQSSSKQAQIKFLHHYISLQRPQTPQVQKTANILQQSMKSPELPKKSNQNKFPVTFQQSICPLDPVAPQSPSF